MRGGLNLSLLWRKLLEAMIKLDYDQVSTTFMIGSNKTARMHLNSSELARSEVIR